MFTKFKKAMQDNFALLLVQGGGVLYTTAALKEEMWDKYLGSFPENVRQEYNCNCCKSFIRQYGNVVAIVNGQVKSIWGFPCEFPFDQVANAMNNLVLQKQITNVFFSTFPGLGTDKNVQLKEDKTTVTWNHMYFKLPKEMVTRSAKSIEALQGEARDNRNVFKRSLDEITVDAIDTVLDLIAQNSLYRGAEYKGMLDQFLALKKDYDTVAPVYKETYAWVKGSQYAGSVAKIRNTAIGTLLTDITEGKDLDQAVSAFERIMAPTNYKRPNAIISKKMVEEAEKTITSLGYSESLGRRFATVDDLTVNNLLFVDRGIKQSVSLLGDLRESVPISAKTLGRVEEIGIDDFISNVLPRAAIIEVLFENRHINNLVSLITSTSKDAPSMFKWDNSFSWSYKDAVADSIKEKVKAAGGRIEGELRASLAWWNYDDLDLHMREPGGGHIYFSSKVSPTTGGNLDVDMNAGGRQSKTPVENIIYPNQVKMPDGQYVVSVNQFSRRDTVDVGFQVELECQGQILTFNYDRSLAEKQFIEVAVLEYTKKGGMKIIRSLDHNAKVSSKTVWGVDTNKFHRASMVMQSPNYWQDVAHGGHGNAHLLFILDQAHNDEQARGFFNEFLKPELEVHKRVFEALGSRTKVAPADKQVSGLGFSSTQHSDIIVKVGGAFTRTLKIIF